MNQGEGWCSNKKSCMGVAGEGGWSKDGETQDVKPETASTEELGQELNDEGFDMLLKVNPIPELGHWI